MNVFTAWDRGIREATGEYFITMHSDVFVKRDDWLDPFLTRIAQGEKNAGVGAWKLELENPIYAFQKRVFSFISRSVKSLFGKEKRVYWKRGDFPRNYCAMYRRRVIPEHDLTFRPLFNAGGGYSIAKQLWDRSYQPIMIPVSELMPRIVYVAHGTAAIVAEKPLRHRRSQNKVERRVAALLSQGWVKSPQQDPSLDY